MTTYYLVAVDENGDVMAGRMIESARIGLDISLRSASTDPSNFAFENHGDDAGSKWEAARQALGSLMPDEDEPLPPCDCCRTMDGYRVAHGKDE